MQAKGIVNRLRSALDQELQAKTGWGRNEVMQVFERAVSSTLDELILISDKPPTRNEIDQLRSGATCNCGPTECCGLCE